NNAISGIVKINETLGSCDSAVSVPVKIWALPRSYISGAQMVCQYDSNIAYYATFDPTYKYQWSVTGGIIQGPSNTNSIRVRWGAPGKNAISLKILNQLGCDSTVNFNVTVFAKPY